MTGSTFRANAATRSRVAAAPFGLRLAKVGPVAQYRALRLLACQRLACPLRDQSALLLGEGCGVDRSVDRRTPLTLARFLAIALEFQLGADILSTAVAPSWDAIGKLAAIAVIRTALNYFLSREMRS
jgi:hypothetical protein